MRDKDRLLRKFHAAMLVVSGAIGFAFSSGVGAADRQNAGQGSVRPTAKSVAITFDDLPFVIEGDRANPTQRARQANAAIVSALRRYRAPATGFVIEANVQRLGKTGLAIVRQWNTGSLQLGNHSFSHADSNALDLAGVEREIIKGEATIRPLAAFAGRPIRYFRFPMNHVGDTDAKRIGIAKLLENHGYKLAASTIDTSDYLFNSAYERALSNGDRAAERRIEAAYVDYTAIQVDYYDRLDRRVMGRNIPAVMLLHLSALNAATLPRILDIFTRSGYEFVTLDAAQADPAYDRDPAYTTKYGPMWGYRWARERHIKVDGSLEREPPAWIAEYAANGKMVE